MRKNNPHTHQKQFNPKDYARPGLSEQEIIEIKQSFDLFDPEGNGHINPKGKYSS